MKITGPTNINLVNLIKDLKRESISQKVNIWKRIAKDLEKPTRSRRVVNLSRINRYTKENETIIVPGKVLGAGDLKHKVNIAAFSFSESAKSEVSKLNGKCLTITELMQQNPKGNNVRIIG